MSGPYRAAGKEVLRDREHIADAADETYAQIIADALNDERVSPAPGKLCYAPEGYKVNDAASVAELIEDAKAYINSIGQRFPPGEPESHHVTQRPDGGYNCSCGRSWDRDEGDECPGAAS